MITTSNRKVSIYITTYKKKDLEANTMERTKQHQNESDKRFLCSICSSSNGCNSFSCGNRFARPCPICCKNYSCDHKCDKRNESNFKYRNTTANGFHETYDPKHLNTKDVQTSQTDLTQDLSLLKEVLTVFQSKKQIDVKNSKTVVMKDVSVETSNSKVELQAKLTKSRVFQFSIEDDNKNNGNQFKIVNYSQPNNVLTSEYSIDLSKQKSSSIPQMKLEELKYSLKEKSKSKDAIEEVNRMFATVRKSDLSNLEEHNRPMIRNGPRVLPVVKTKSYHKKKNSDSELENEAKKSYQEKNENSDTDKQSCKCCQSKGIQLSGGDSFFKHECCYHKMMNEGRCEKCVYMLCCHYQKHNTIETGALVCECCRENPNKESNERDEKNNHCNHF